MIAREYKKMPNISIDYAVLEKAGAEGKVRDPRSRLRLERRGELGRSLPYVAPRPERQRRKRQMAHPEGPRILLSTSEDRLVVLLGVEDTVVVDTPDALLVGDIKRSQEVRELVEELKNKGYGAYTVK